MKFFCGKFVAILLLRNGVVVKAQPRSPNAPRPIAPRKPAAPFPKSLVQAPKPAAPLPKAVASVPKPAASLPKPVAPVKPKAPAPIPVAPLPKPVAPAPDSGCPAIVPYTQPPAAQCATCYRNMTALTKYLNGASKDVSATVCSGKYAWPATAAVDNGNIMSLTLSCCGDAKSCIIDGGAPYVNRTKRLFTFVNPIKNLDIQGITFQNINCSDNYYYECDGALLATLSTALVSFKHNTVSKVSTFSKGALYNRDPSIVYVEDCTFSDNTAANFYGTACFVSYGSTVRMNGNSFLRNSAYSVGAVSLYDSEAAANCNKFEGNQAIATNSGVTLEEAGCGAIFLVSSSLDAKLNVFTNNTASSGGAIYASFSHITAKSNTYTTNTAYNGDGGAIHGIYAVMVIDSDTFTKNSATLDGDNIYLGEHSVLTTCNSTVVDVYVGISALSIVNCF